MSSFEIFSYLSKNAKKSSTGASLKLKVEKSLPRPAYEFCIKASHAFNILDARSAISVTERQRYIMRIRDLACAAATKYVESFKEG